MKRFENAQVGDEVYCRLHGEGTIAKIIKEDTISIFVCFKTPFDIESYTFDGKADITNVEPTLFYRKGDEKYLTERPEPEIDWSKVTVGTKAFISDDESVLKTNDEATLKETFLFYLPDYEYPYWISIDLYNDKAAGFKYCKLAEPCKPEWIKK